MTRKSNALALAALLALGVNSPAVAQDTVSYQGLLKEAGATLAGQVDLEFTLYDAELGGNQVGATIAVSGVDVVDGLFTVQLDFGSAVFDGGPRWLEIAVASPAGGPFTLLAPRQPVTAAPYALYALNSPGGGNSPWQVTGADLYYDAGNVGIGTAAPTSPLHVDGVAVATAFSVPNPDNPGASFNLSWLDDVPRIRYGGNGPGSHNGFAIHGTGDSVKLRLLDNGALGLGTSDPGSVFNSKLDVVGGHIAVDNNYGIFSYNSAGNGVGAGIDTTTGDDLHLYAGGAAQAGVTAAGDVGIGTTSPAATLDVRGRLVLDDGDGALVYTAASGGEQSEYMRLINSPDHSSASGLKAGGVLVADNFSYANPGKNDLIVKGSVGVGTAAPSATLHVASDAFPNVKITQTDNADFARLMLDGNGSEVQLNVGSPGTNLPGTFNIYRPGVGNMLSIAPDGAVGIGTSIPQAALHVDGAAIFDGPVIIPITTRYAMISAPAFHPNSVSSIAEAGGTPVIYGGAPLGTSGGLADVALPDGARITELRAHLTDNSSTENMTVELRRYDLTGNSSSIASTTSSGQSSTPLAFSTNLSHTVDNANYAYYVKVSWDDIPSGALRLRSVRIKYTVDEPLP